MKAMTLPLVAALLVGCADKHPVTVPGDPMLLHGRYTGTLRERPANGLGEPESAQLTAAASYMSGSQYRSSGTLNVAGQTYTFTGVGTGSLVKFQPQWSPAYPTVMFEADLLLGGQKVGLLMWTTSRPTQPEPYILYVALNNQPYELRLSRQD